MSKLTICSYVMILSSLISSFSQILLKKSTKKIYNLKLKEYLNSYVITAYIMVFVCTLISVMALKVVPLSMSPLLDSSGYIFVAVLSYVFFKEKLTKKQILGMILIIVGIVIYTSNF